MPSCLSEPMPYLLEVYAWREKGYEMVFYAEETGEIRSNVLPDFTMDVVDVFGV